MHYERTRTSRTSNLGSRANRALREHFKMKNWDVPLLKAKAFGAREPDARRLSFLFLLPDRDGGSPATPFARPLVVVVEVVVVVGVAA